MSSILMVSPAAKEELEKINELLVDGYPGKAGVLLGDFLDKVLVVGVDDTVISEEIPE